MATGTFTYNALRTKIVKERIKTQRKIASYSNLTQSNAVSVGTTSIKPYLSICPVGLVWFARYCGKMYMYSRHLFSYGGFREESSMGCKSRLEIITLRLFSVNSENLNQNFLSNGM